MKLNLGLFLVLSILLGCGKPADNAPAPTHDLGAKPCDGDCPSSKRLSGRFPVVELDGSTETIGMITIQTDAASVGYRLEPMKLAAHPVPATEMFSPRESTVWFEEGDSTIQTYAANNRPLRIEYKRHKGYLEIITGQQTRGTTTQELIVLQDGAPGNPLDAHVFFNRLQGDYTVTLAGGRAPHADATNAQVIPALDSETAYIEVPFCDPAAGCSDGWYFSYSSCKVFERKLSATHTIYTIIEPRAGKPTSYYLWDDNNGQIVFRNLQFKVKNDVWDLEHSLVKRHN